VIFYLRIFWFPFIVLNYAAGATRSGSATSSSGRRWDCSPPSSSPRTFFGGDEGGARDVPPAGGPA